jgi:hypothetical protein
VNYAKIITRDFPDDFGAWQAADVAARLGLRVVSIVCAPGRTVRSASDSFTPPPRWHVYVEAHLEYEVKRWDAAIAQAQKETP